MTADTPTEVTDITPATSRAEPASLLELPPEQQRQWLAMFDALLRDRWFATFLRSFKLAETPEGMVVERGPMAYLPRELPRIQVAGAQVVLSQEGCIHPGRAWARLLDLLSPASTPPQTAAPSPEAAPLPPADGLQGAPAPEVGQA